MAMTPTGGGGRSPASAARLKPSGLWSGVYGAGMALVFAGERIFATGKARAVCSILGLACVVVAIIARLVRGRGVAQDRRTVENGLLSMYALGLLAVALYFLQSDVPALRGGKSLSTTSPKLATALAALWPVLWIASAFAVVSMELAYATMARAPRLELGRVRSAQLSGLGLAFALTFGFALAYIAAERDKKVDLAYFRTTRPGESTRKIVRALDKPITVAMFFPSANEVREEVDNYFRDLSKESPLLKLERYDYDIDPKKATEYGVSANGIVVVAREGRKEQLGLQLQLENARSSLRNLDREVQQRLLTVVKPNRVTLLTQGHGERSMNPANATDRRAGIRDLREALLDQGHDVRDLGPAEGLATDVPKDATLVMVLGPTKPFSAEEIGSLQRYMARGGRLYLALDPDGGVSMEEILGPLGVRLTMKPLANDQLYARRAHQDSDRQNLISGMFSSHASVSTLSRLSMRAPVLLPGATAVEGPRDRTQRQDVVIDYPVHGHFATFEDANGNFTADEKEDRKAWELAAAITVPAKDKDKVEQRIFLVGDSDFLSDGVIRFAGNGLLVLDPVRWLLGEESFSGQISTETDVPITHTRKQDVAWFYTSIFAVPAVVLGTGLTLTRRRRRARSPGAARGPGGDAGSAGGPAEPATSAGQKGSAP